MKTITKEEYSEIVNIGIAPKPFPIKQWERFSDYCYKNRTVSEMVRAIQHPHNQYECSSWGITPSEWKKAINAALAAKAYDYRNR
jgi:hypothetical protein